MNIILIGFMYSGKTTIAPILGEKLTKEVIEIDTVITQIAGISPEEIFKQYGELRFRELEIAAAKSLQEKDNVIISTGGGAVMNKIIFDYLQKDSVTVFLETSFQTLLKRLQPNSGRPLFRNIHNAQELFNFRYPLYKAYATFSVTTDDKSPDSIADEIIIKLKNI